MKLLDKFLNTTERVHNPGAHGGDSPLYEHEVQKALDLIAKLENAWAEEHDIQPNQPAYK